MKKVAIIADGWKKYVNYAWVTGCQQYMQEHEIDACLYNFHSFGNFSKDDKFNQGEYNIFNLPDFREFDGIILEVTNIMNREAKDALIQRVQASRVPAVSMVEHIPGLYYVGIDNYTAMEHIVEHLVEEHGCKRLCFVGGPKTSDENNLRYQAYQDVLKRHGIELREEDTYFGSYEVETGEVAFEHFSKLGICPDAFVCANDNIAVGLCHKAKQMGCSVPEDFCVTGFDNFDKAAYYSPRITTVGFTREHIAYEAMATLDRIWQGEEAKAEHYADIAWVFQESCGCHNEVPADRGQYVVDRIFAEQYEDRLQNSLMELKRDLVDAKSYQDMAVCVHKRQEILNCEAAYIMMNADIVNGEDISKFDTNEETHYIQVGYPREMEVIMACEGDEVLNNCHLLPGELFPGENHADAGDLYLFAPLHFRDQEIGYMVLKNCYYLMDTQLLFEILSQFQDTLEHMYHRIVLQRMNEELERLYIMDSLTGVYNRMAYNHLAVPMFERCKDHRDPLAILFVDMDRLKYINDSFGHDSGNVAIKTLALALSHCIPKDAMCMRYGGDEFLVLVPEMEENGVEAMIHRIEANMKSTSEAMNAGFVISASIGYVVAKDYDKSFNEYINMADDRMYEIKKEAKKLYVE